MHKAIISGFILSFMLIFLAAEPASAAFWDTKGDNTIHDPSMIKEGNTWYTFGTGVGKGIRVIKSQDGKSWSTSQTIFSIPLSWWKKYVPKHEQNQWAPDISYYKGRYWLYYAVSSFGSNTSAIGLASTDRISSGNWRDDGLVTRTTASNNYNAIDPDMVVDKEGNPWLSFGSFWSGIKLTRLDQNTMKPTGKLYSIASRPRNGGALEAPTITYKNGYYYLFVSFDKCCKGVNSTYKIAYGRSTKITGPYYDKSGKQMTEGGGTILDSGNVRWKGPGGEDILNGNIIIRHSYDALDNGVSKLLINDLYWDSKGWPHY